MALSHSMLPLSFNQQCDGCACSFRATDAMKLVKACYNVANGFSRTTSLVPAIGTFFLGPPARRKLEEFDEFTTCPNESS